MGRLAEIIAKHELEEFGEKAGKIMSLEEEKEYEECMEDFMILIADEIFDVINNMKADPIEKELNKKAFSQGFGEQQDVLDRFMYVVRYIEMMWMVQDRKENKKLTRKNKKAIRRLARKFERMTGCKWYFFC